MCSFIWAPRPTLHWMKKTKYTQQNRKKTAFWILYFIYSGLHKQHETLLKWLCIKRHSSFFLFLFFEQSQMDAYIYRNYYIVKPKRKTRDEKKTYRCWRMSSRRWIHFWRNKKMFSLDLVLELCVIDK